MREFKPGFIQSFEPNQMKFKLVIFLLFAIWTSGQAQIANSTFDDLCMGCCGLKLDFGPSEIVWTEKGGHAMRYELARWTFEHDTLRIQYGKEDSHIVSYIIIDSLTISNTGSDSKLKKVSESPRDSIRITYQYVDLELSAIKTYKSGILIRWREYDGNNLMERTFNDLGILQSMGVRKKGKKKGTWSYYNVHGELVETIEY